MTGPVCVGLVAAGLLALASAHGVHGKDTDNSAIGGDVSDLLEMVPCDQLAALFFEYLSADQQVNRVLHYLTSEQFKANLVQFETATPFHEAYDSLAPLGVDIYAWTNELNRLLDIAQVRPVRMRRRRSPGEGLLGLVKDAMAVTPLSDIRDAYNHKLDTNPHFERVMDRLLTVELRNHIYTLMSTPQFEAMVHELNNMDVPVSEIIDLVEEQVIDFFDLESKEEDDDDAEE